LRSGQFSHLISALTHTNIVAGLATALAQRNVRLILTEHGLDGAEACSASACFRFIARLAYGSAFAVVAVSQGLAERWQALLPTAPVVTIYNPVVPDAASAVPAPAHPWLQHKDVPVIMGIGRLKAEKNFQLLIRAFAKLAAQIPARLIILGEGEQRAMLENLANALGVQDKILMPGFVASPDGWLPYARLLVCPSKREGLGNVLIEAMAQGVPVIATDCPYGPSEILVKGQYGKLVPMDDVDALCRAMRETIDTASDARMLRRRASDFTVSRCIDAYLRLVDNAPSS
jgi:glycosyltransferase involved in cell wall biosynthesis